MTAGHSRSFERIRPFRFALATALLATPSTARAGVPAFVDATVEVGLSGVHASGALYGPGVSVVDFDLDGDLDLFVCDDTDGNRLYRNEGGVLRDVAPELGLNWRPAEVTIPGHPNVADVSSMMPCFVDVDNDGDRDLFLTVWNLPCMFWRNDGAGGYTEEATAVGLDVVGPSATAAFGDYNRDGRLDVYVASWGELDNLFRNAGANGFRNVSDAAGLWEVPVATRPGWCAIWHYQDADLNPDLYVGNDFALPNFSYWNLGNGSFLENADQWFEPAHNLGASMGQCFGDFDHDGDDDLYVANAQNQVNDFYQRRPNRYVNLMLTGDPIARPLKDTMVGWFCGWLDVDNDGWLDLYLVNGYIPTCPKDIPEFPHRCPTPGIPIQRNRLWRNLGGSFEDVSANSGLDDPNYGRAAAVSDFDLDGDLDIFVTNNNGPYLYMRNESEGVGHWLTLRLRGTVSNTDAVGARVFATVGDYTHRRTHVATTGFLSQPSDEIYIGVGEATQIDELRVVWPQNGREEIFFDVPVDRRITLVEGVSETYDTLPEGPGLAATATASGVEISILIPADAGFSEYVVHRAERGLWSGVVHRGSVEASEFVWTDTGVEAGKSYDYHVMAVASDLEIGSAAATAEAVSDQPLLAPILQPSYPNPFNPQLTIPVVIPGRGPKQVDLGVYDVAGRRLRSLFTGVRSPGEWTPAPTFDGRDDDGNELPSGIYYLRLDVDGYDVLSRKVTLLR